MRHGCTMTKTVNSSMQFNVFITICMCYMLIWYYFVVYYYLTLCLQWKLYTLSNIAYMYHMITLLSFYWIWYPYVILLCGIFMNMYRNICINSQFIKLYNYTISGRGNIHSQGVAYSRRYAVDGALSQIICDYKKVYKCLKIKAWCQFKRSIT